MKKEKKRPTGLIITAVIFGLLDVAALALLICVIFISPVKKKAVEVSLPADFQENAQGYDSLDMTADYPSSATVSYGGAGSVSKKQQVQDDGLGDPYVDDPNNLNSYNNNSNKDDSTVTASNDPYDGFVFPDSDTTVITKTRMKETLTSKSLCRRAINELYARHGYQFTKQENTDYFNQYDWYRNMIKEPDMSVIASEFSSTEKKNVEALQAYEDSKGWS